MLFRFSAGLLFLLFTTCVFSQNISDKNYREEDLQGLLEQIDEDQVLQLELLTALHFHKLINDYRNSKGYKSIYWDHKLWLAARNHNVYLLRDIKYLSHTQARSKQFFTGQYPEDRVSYVIYSSKEFKQAGFENCYGRSSLDRMSTSILDKDDINQYALNTAQEAFKAWKKSSGHNQNMLNSEHMTHGTSFIFGKDGSHATSVFAQKQESYEPDTLSFSCFESLVDLKDVKIKVDYHDLSLPEDKLERTNYKCFYMVMEFFKSENIERNKALYKMTELKRTPKDQKELKKAYRKQRGVKGIFELFGSEIKYHEEIIRLNYAEFIQLKAADPIRSKLKKITSEYNGKEIKSWGGDVNTQRIGEEVEIQIKLLLLVEN